VGAVEKERMGGKTRWGETNLNLQRGSDGGFRGILEGGKGMTFCQRRDGTRRTGDEADLEILD